jgi:hypothetical protein
MLASRLVQRASRFSVRGLHTSVPAFADAEKNADVSPAGIDRTKPLYAPSYRREWKHFGYPKEQIANVDNPAEWKEWTDLPAPYKYYHVKVDPADVENEGTLWKLFTNWKTAIPLSVGIAIPLWVNDVIVMDFHMELAAIFWASIAMVYNNFGSTIRAALVEENTEIKRQVFDAESKYMAALERNIEVHEKAIGLPQYVMMLNKGERHVRGLEANASTKHMRAAETQRMIDMLDYLSTGRTAGGSGAGDLVSSAVHHAVGLALQRNAQMQQATVQDAIDALLAEGVPKRGNVTEKLFAGASKHFKANPPRAADVDPAAQAAHEKELFNKRFGFADTTITETMISKAKDSAASWSVLKAMAGGAEPTVGAPIVYPNPIAYSK